MATNNEASFGPDNVEALLPWHATGVLQPAEVDEVVRAVARSPDLVRRLAQIRREQAETIEANERLPKPSARPMARLLAAIATEKASQRPAPSLLGLAARVMRR